MNAKLKDTLKRILPVTIKRAEKILEYKTVELMVKSRPKVMLDFEVQLVDHCNLNCAGCSHFSSISDEKFLDKKEYEKDLKRLSKLANGEASIIRLMGGEPLLHPDIKFFIKITRKCFTKARIDLDTNGILVSTMKDDFFKALHDNNVNLVVTKYPIKLNYKNIEEICKKHDVNFVFFDNKKVRKFNILPLDVNGEQRIEENFYKCYLSNNCHTLRHGKMYTCSTIPYIEYFNKEFSKNLEVSNKDYIDIYKVKSIDEILNFLSKPVPFCRYCNVEKREYEIGWKQTKKDIHEWKVKD